MTIKKITILTIIIMILNLSLYSTVWMAIGAPLSLCENRLKDYNSRWRGYSTGVDFSLDFNIFKSKKITFFTHAGYTKKQYQLPPIDPPWFVGDSGFMVIDNFRYGFDIRFWPTTQLIFSIGQLFSSSRKAKYGDNTFTNSISQQLLGTDIYFKIGSGYNIIFNKEWQLMIEGFFLNNITSIYQGYERELLLLISIRYRLYR